MKRIDEIRRRFNGGGYGGGLYYDSVGEDKRLAAALALRGSVEQDIDYLLDRLEEMEKMVEVLAKELADYMDCPAATYPEIDGVDCEKCEDEYEACWRQYAQAQAKKRLGTATNDPR